MKKVTQKFFKTAGSETGLSSDLSITHNDKSVFVTGAINGLTALDFKGNNVKNLQGKDDIFVSRLDKNGRQKFFKTAGGIEDDSGLSVASNENHVFVTGFLRGKTAIDFKGNVINLQAELTPTQDIFVAGLDNRGCQKFFKTAGGKNDDSGVSISTNNNCVYVTGSVVGPTALDFKENLVDIKSSSAIFVAGLDERGCQKFFKTAGGKTITSGIDIYANDDGVFVTGLISGVFLNNGTGTDFNGKTFELKGNREIFVAKLDHNGCQKFFKTAGAGSDLIVPFDIGLSIKANNNGVFVTGRIDGKTALDFKGNVINLQGEIFDEVAIPPDIFVARLDHKGCQKFFKTAGGISADQGVSLATNDSGVFVTGSVNGQTALDFKKNIKYLQGRGDIFVAGLNNNGCQKFFKTAGGKGVDEAFSITADEKKIFVTGLVSGETALDFNGNVKNIKGDRGIFVAGLDLGIKPDRILGKGFRSKMQYN